MISSALADTARAVMVTAEVVTLKASDQHLWLS